MRHLNSVVQGEYRDRVIVVHPQLRLYTRALGVFDALKGKVEMTAPRFNVGARQNVCVHLYVQYASDVFV